MTKPVRESGPIALVTSQLAFGGAERYVVSLANELARSGERVCAISSGGSMQDFLRVPHLLAPIDRRDPLSMLRSALVIRGARPRLVHVNSLNAAVAAQLARRTHRTPVVLTGHGWPGRDLRQVARLAATTSDRVIAVSEAVAGGLAAAGFPGGRLVVVPNGVDTTVFKPPLDRAALRHRMGLGGERVVLFLGRLEAVKGIDVLLAAWKQLSIEATLVVAGEGSLRHLLERPPRGVRYLGPRADAAELLGCADLLVLPSRSEGLPMVVLEAMACGLPVLASDVGGVAEAVDRRVGRLVPPGDPVALAGGLMELLASPALGEQGAAALARALERFTLTRMVERIREVYADLGGVRPAA